MNERSSPVLGRACGFGRRAASILTPLAIALLALAVRLPNWPTIPAAGDETLQAVVAYEIAEGRKAPLVGNDAYAGPFFFYLLALLFRLGHLDPMAGRAIMVAAGSLTVPITYEWARRLSGSHLAGCVAAGLTLANPHLVLLNSHLGGTTYLLPFWVSLLLLCLTLAAHKDRPSWLLLAALAAGLALQANPLAVLPVAGALACLMLHTRRAPRLGRRWPMWPAVFGLCTLVVYSPVIVYNVVSQLDTLRVLHARSYLWESRPTVHTFVSNLQRLTMQLVRQMSGVVRGDETWRTLAGVPSLFGVWMLAGVAIAIRRRLGLPLAVIVPFLGVMPWVSSHYGLLHPVRFTTLLIPVFAAPMGIVVAAFGKRTSAAPGPFRALLQGLGCAALVALLVFPAARLYAYYDWAEDNHRTGRVLLQLSRQLVAENSGQTVYISRSNGMPQIEGMLYVPAAHLLFAGAPYEVLTVEEIIARLYEHPQEAPIMLLGTGDIGLVEQTAALVAWPGAPGKESSTFGYGVFTRAPGVPLAKPAFVLGSRALENLPMAPVGAILGRGTELVGYHIADGTAADRSWVDLALYWRALRPLPRATYVRFVHLYEVASGAVLAQDDRVLGAVEYPAYVWQPGEIVADRVRLHPPDGWASTSCRLRLGVYLWPSMERMDVPGHRDSVIELPLAFDDP